MYGDFNIDLLKHETHNNTKEFRDTMHSLSLYPLIDKPTRITDNSTTLIDNIFTNELRFNLTSGIMFNDISDHLPIFALCEYNISKYNEKEFQFIRKMNEDTMESFSNELNQQTWENVLKTDDGNQAYDSFLHIFMDIFNKHCPVKNVSPKREKRKKIWFTDGLKRACTKKNRLYKAFIVLRSAEAEQKYKTYTNKLTSILRSTEKNYYSSLLEKQKANVKETWKILNEVINKHKNKPQEKQQENVKDR